MNLNFLLIQADQQRRDFLGVYGQRAARTPHIDALAAGAGGVVFDNAFCPAPICGPARASLVTGLRPMHHGICFNSESGSPAGRDFARADGRPGRPDTLAELLAPAGYRSTLCGKWHVGTTLTPAECGFDGQFYPGYGNPAEEPRHPRFADYLRRIGCDYKLVEPLAGRYADGSQGPLLSAVLDAPPEATVEHFLAEEAIAAVGRAVEAGTPFFVRCDFWGPHAPYVIPRDYAAMVRPADLPPWPNFDDDLADKPAVQRTMKRYWAVDRFGWNPWSRLVAMCCGYTALIDAQVGRLLAALERFGVAGRTAVFYTSDHGGMVGGHGLCDKGPYLYDETVRIPLIARLPGQPGPPRRSDAVVYNMDLMPTILELAGLEAPGGLDAASLAPILAGRADAARDGDDAFVEFHGHQGPYAQRMVRTASAKYVFNAPGRDELYDLSNDPAELRNLADEPAAADLLAAMRRRLANHIVANDDPIRRFYELSRLRG